MSNSLHDQNNVRTMIGALDSDGVTPTLIYANGVTHILQTSDGVLGNDLSGAEAIRDENNVVGLLAVSSVDGVTPVPVYVNAAHQLLIKST